MASDPPQAMTVGSSLIQRYYRCLATEPESLPELFHADAVLQHSIGNEEATVHEGKEAISKFFLDLPYSSVALNLDDGAVDAQACGKDIIIMLTGLIGYDGAPATMRFAHTLMVAEVLTTTGVSYIIKADIFRAYAAPLPPKATPPVAPAVATLPLRQAAPAPAPAPKPEPEPEPEPQTFAEPEPPVAEAPAPPTPTDEVAPAAAKKAPKPAAKAKTDGKAEAKGRGRPRGRGKGKAPQETKPAASAPAPVAAPAPTESKPAAAKAPMSYASAAKASGDAPAPAPAPKPTRTRGQGKARPAAAAKAPVAASATAESAPEATASKAAGKEEVWSKPKPSGGRGGRSSGAGRRGLQAAGSVRLSGDLSDIKEGNIVSVLKKFGTIVGVSTSTMKKNYVFVDFTTQEAVAKAASAGTITIGAVTLDVQVKENFDANRAGRGGPGRRSPKRGGRSAAKRAAPAAAM